MDLQELTSRSRILFAKATERLGVFKLVNGHRTAADIAISMKRNVNNVHRDLRRLSDAELIRVRIRADERPLRIMGFLVYEKVPLARTIPASYFRDRVEPQRQRPRVKKARIEKPKARTQALSVPTGPEILDICRKGEDQIYEFKGPGTELRKITKEIAAMLNTKQGGLILYGIADNGKMQGTDVTRQEFDQRLHNSVRNLIDPAATVTLKSVPLLNGEILVIIVPPWNGSDVYMFEEKVLLRKGTNTFAAKPEELRELFLGEPVV